MRTPTAADLALERVALEQFGVFSRHQALEAGLSIPQVRHRVDSGAWQRVAPGVYSFPARADSWERSLWIAHLHAGPCSLISHGAAARLHDLQPVEGESVELIVGRSQTRALEGTTRHRPRQFDRSHVDVVRGLPVTDVARTVLDLAPDASLGRLKEIVERAVLEQKMSTELLASRLGLHRADGRPGVVRTQRVLDALGPGADLPRSDAERLLREVIDLAGLPDPQFEHPLPTTSQMVGFVDCAFPPAMLIVEADSRRWHARRAQIAKDAQRDLEAGMLGWYTARVLWETLASDPVGTAASLSALYDQRLALLGR
jgi:predicted transcriptional regulator of viral defense system/very-short-patch-repair endonuclease